MFVWTIIMPRFGWLEHFPYWINKKLQAFVFCGRQARLDRVENRDKKWHGFSWAICSSDENVEFLSIWIDCHFQCLWLNYSGVLFAVVIECLDEVFMQLKISPLLLGFNVGLVLVFVVVVLTGKGSGGFLYDANVIFREHEVCVCVWAGAELF